MPTYVPSGIFSQPYLLKLMLAQSSTFRSVVKAADAAAARRRIHYPEVETRDGDGELIGYHLPPRAIICDETDLSRAKLGNGIWTTSGTLLLSFEFYVPAEVAAEGHENASAWFMHQTGSIMSDLESLSGTGDSVSGQTNLNLVRYSRRAGPFEMLTEEMDLPDPDANEYSKSLWCITFDVSFF